MAEFRIEKVVSGGQTGVDRAALDVAIYLDIPHGGWCPRGRRAEDGRIPETYQLRETSSRDYASRTEQNILDSDATLILYAKKLSGGSGLTLRLAQQHRRPVLCVDLSPSRGRRIQTRRRPGNGLVASPWGAGIERGWTAGQYQREFGALLRAVFATGFGEIHVGGAHLSSATGKRFTTLYRTWE